MISPCCWGVGGGEDPGGCRLAGVLSARPGAEVNVQPAQVPAPARVSFFADPLGWLLGIFGVT